MSPCDAQPSPFASDQSDMSCPAISITSDTPVRRMIGASDFASTFGTNLAIQLCTMVQAVFLARLLEPTGRGQFAAAILWPSIFAAVGGMGVNVALARRAASVTDLGRLIRTALVLTLATSTLATICCAAVLPWLMAEVDGVSRSAAWYFLPYIVFNHIALGLIAIDQGAGRFREFNLTRLIINPAYLILIVVLWLSGTREVHWYVIGLAAANGLVAIFRVAMAARNYSLIGPLESVMAVLRQSVPYGAAGLISPLLQSADKALVLYLVGTTQLGFYTVALTAASVINSLATSAGIVSFGIAAQEHESGAFPRVARMFRFTAWIWLVAGICLAIAIPLLMPLIYGSQFTPAVWPAIVLIPAAAFAGQAGILEEAMRAQGRAFIGLEARLAGMAVFLVAGWFLADRFGVVGVTLAFVAAQAVALAFMLCAARWHFTQATLANLMPRWADLQELLLRLRSQVRAVSGVAAK
jgi:enterobacterial common antigen flippase